MTVALTPPLSIMWSPLDYALGEDARGLRDQRERALRLSVTIFGQRMLRALETLYALWLETQTENWDGYGACPITSATINNVVAFLRALPPDHDLPEMTAEPDGEIALEWYREPRAVFSVSVSPTGLLSYAGLYGWSRVHGVEPFSGSVPVPVLSNLERLYRLPLR